MILGEYIERILKLQRKRDYIAAYNILQDALSYYPSNEFLQTSEIYLLFRLKRTKEARQKAEARLSTLRTNPFFLRTYIEILSKERDKEGLFQVAERLKAFPVNDDRLYAYLAGSLARIGERQKGVELLESGLSFMPQSIELRKCLEGIKEGSQGVGVNYYRERFRDVPPERAIKEIENIIILPDLANNIPIRLFLAELYKRSGDLRRASEVYSDCLRIKDSPNIRKMLGFLYYRIGDMGKAFFYLRDAFIEDPDDHVLYNTISKILEKKKDIKGAEALIRDVLGRHPEAGQVYGLLKRLKKIDTGIC